MLEQWHVLLPSVSFFNLFHPDAQSLWSLAKMKSGFQGESMSGLGVGNGRFYVQDELGSGQLISLPRFSRMFLKTTKLSYLDCSLISRIFVKPLSSFFPFLRRFRFVF